MGFGPMHVIGESSKALPGRGGQGLGSLDHLYRRGHDAVHEAHLQLVRHALGHIQAALLWASCKAHTEAMI